MAIRNVASGKTGGIGPVRYVENGKTVNIPVGYVVEGGKTVLVFGGSGGNGGDGLDDSYTYLYRYGSFTDLIVGVNVSKEGTATYTEGSDGIVLHCPADESYMFVAFTTANAVVSPTIGTYSKIGILYDYTGPDWTTNTDSYGLGLFLVDAATDTTSAYAKSLRPSSSEKNKVEYVDISDTPQSYYQRLCAGIYLGEEDYGTEVTWKIKAIWLE